MMAIYDFEEGLDYAQEIDEFMLRASVLLFFGDGERVSAYNSVGSTSLSGLSRLFIPILIAAAIVFNTMLGAVYERTREIGIFCSVGLAPNHIGALFLAESFVFATLAAVVGYLAAQVLGFTLASSDMFSEINLNYSSLSAVAATMIVMVTVVLSTLYPSRKASEMAVPDVTRKWAMEKPKGDLWEFEFPFTIGGGDAAGLNVFLYEFFKASSDSSAGRFFTNEAQLNTTEYPSIGTGYEIRFNAWLAPYDMSISQHIALRSIPTGEHGVYRVEVAIQRLSGEVGSWVRMNREFLNTLRKRFLVWRTVPPALKGRFAERVESATETA